MRASLAGRGDQRRAGLAYAALGAVSGDGQERHRRCEERRRSLWWGDHSGGVPFQLRRRLSLGTHGYRRYRLGRQADGLRAERRDRHRRAVACPGAARLGWGALALSQARYVVSGELGKGATRGSSLGQQSISTSLQRSRMARQAHEEGQSDAGRDDYSLLGGTRQLSCARATNDADWWQHRLC